LLAPEDGVPSQPMARIAFEKAGIAKKGVPIAALDQVPDATRQLILRAESAGADLFLFGHDWSNKIEIEEDGPRHTYRDATGEFDLPLPRLNGPHQVRNAGLAAAMLRHQDEVEVSLPAIKAGVARADWPGRFQRLSRGPLAGDREVWIDGGHNPSAGQAMADFWADCPMHLVIGMLANKNPKAIIDPLAKWTSSLTAVPVPGHDHHTPDAFDAAAKPADDLLAALEGLPQDGLPVFITGSLYLVGEALRLNDELPT